MDPGTQRILIYRNWQLWSLLAVLALLVLAGGWWLYDKGMHDGAGALTRLEREREELRIELRELNKDRRRQADQLAVLERSSQIDRQASLEVRQSLGDLQDEIVRLREELAFYQGIMAPGEVEPGIRIHRLKWEPVSEDGSFHYDLTLVQYKRNDRLVQGVVHLFLDGEQDGKAATLSLAQVTEPAVDKLSFRFRYFQHFEGEVRIPARFRPRTVRLEVVPSGKNSPPRVERSFNWPT